MEELTQLLTSGSWVAFAGFGVYLAYKLAIATVVSVAAVKVVAKIVASITQGREVSQRLLQVIAAAGMTYPLTSAEWEEIIKRVRPK